MTSATTPPASALAHARDAFAATHDGDPRALGAFALAAADLHARTEFQVEVTAEGGMQYVSTCESPNLAYTCDWLESLAVWDGSHAVRTVITLAR